MSQMLYLYLAGVVFLTLFGLKCFDAFRAWRFNQVKAIADKAFAEGVKYGSKKANLITPDRPVDAWLRAANAEAEAIMSDVYWWGEAQ